MDRFVALQLFTRIVELGSFTEAAAQLGMPRATATHTIKALESRLGARLLERTTRQVRPTLDGQAFYARSKRILRDLDDAEGALGNADANPQGVLRLDLHGVHAAEIVLPHIHQFRERYPDIELVISTGDRLVDLVKEGIDCVLRVGQPRDSSLVVRRLAELDEVICASPAYLARHGEPVHPRQLPEFEAVRFFSKGSHGGYPFSVLVDGREQHYPARGSVAVSDAWAYSAAALAGCGLIQAPRFRLQPYLEQGRLQQVLTAWRCPSVPVCALYPFHRQLSPRVRVWIDWLAQLYRDRFESAAF